MKSDRDLLADLFRVRGWCWWRVRKTKVNKNESGFGVGTDKGEVLVRGQDVPTFVKTHLVKGTEPTG